jgi:hypothetical protein
VLFQIAKKNELVLFQIAKAIYLFMSCVSFAGAREAVLGCSGGAAEEEEG